MKFADLLISSIQRSEIPLRFEPGAEEAVASPVTEFLRSWVQAHEPENASNEFDLGQKYLVELLLAEIDGQKELP
ncbi:MAG: hypothetical protein WD696_23555 [Bryobacteraceae bacterium]